MHYFAQFQLVSLFRSRSAGEVFSLPLSVAKYKAMQLDVRLHPFPFLYPRCLLSYALHVLKQLLSSFLILQVEIYLNLSEIH
jgi:hypothetical protein